MCVCVCVCVCVLCGGEADIFSARLFRRSKSQSVEVAVLTASTEYMGEVRKPNSYKNKMNLK